jgi:hypothetical protein
MSFFLKLNMFYFKKSIVIVLLQLLFLQNVASDIRNLRVFTTETERTNLIKKEIVKIKPVIKKKPKLRGFIKRKNKNLSTIWLEQQKKTQKHSFSNNSRLPDPTKIIKDKKWLKMLNEK